MTTAYTTTGDYNTLHATRACPQLTNAIGVRETVYDDRPKCDVCHDATTDIDEIPRRVPCPCGGGDAVRTTTPTTTTAGPGTERHFHYKHEGCSLGGTVVTRNGRTERAIGPVFEPARFGVGGHGEGGVAD